MEIFVSDQQLLCFSWVFDDVVKCLNFTVLPLGRPVASYNFSQNHEAVR